MPTVGGRVEKVWKHPVRSLPSMQRFTLYPRFATPGQPKHPSPILCQAGLIGSDCSVRKQLLISQSPCLDGESINDPVFRSLLTVQCGSGRDVGLVGVSFLFCAARCRTNAMLAKLVNSLIQPSPPGSTCFSVYYRIIGMIGHASCGN